MMLFISAMQQLLADGLKSSLPSNQYAEKEKKNKEMGGKIRRKKKMEKREERSEVHTEMVVHITNLSFLMKKI